MNNQTPAQVDPIELRKKLRRLGIGAKFPFSQTAAMGAVTEAMGSEDCEADLECPECEATISGDVAPLNKRPTRLEPEEIAYMVHNWAMQWEVTE